MMQTSTGTVKWFNAPWISYEVVAERGMERSSESEGLRLTCCQERGSFGHAFFAEDSCGRREGSGPTP
jgi:hypothetical protein